MKPEDWGKSKRELQEPCEYCGKQKSLICESGVYSFIEKNKLIAGCSDGCTYEINDEIKINYCPMCGRKLEETNG